MDIHSYFCPSSSKSAPTVSSDSEEEDSSSESQCPSSPRHNLADQVLSCEDKMGEIFPWLECDENYQGVFCNVCRKSESQSQTPQGSNGGVRVTKPFQNWKKGIHKMKAHCR